LKQLKRLHEQRLLLEQRLGWWEVPGEHWVPTLWLGQIVLFVPFVEHGFCLPACPFVHGFLHYYGIKLNHLNPNSILHLSMFVHLCETFIYCITKLLSARCSTWGRLSVIYLSCLRTITLKKPEEVGLS
jgi:hypothetical protein